MLRIFLFLLTNLGVLIVASFAFKVLGLEPMLARQGLDLNLNVVLIFCAVFGFGGSFVSLLLSKTIARLTTRTRVIEQPASREEAWLLQTVETLAREAGVGMPAVGIFPAEQANAFATGWNKNEALVAVSQGLLYRFRPEEVRAVLAHEIGHVANGDMVTLTLIQGVLNTFVLFFAWIIGMLVDKVILKNERGYGIGFWVTRLLAELVLGILASLVVMAFSRWREYRADAAGARLAGRESMISALQRLKADAGLPDELPGELSAFGINGGLSRKARSLLASHPPLDDRILALQHHPGDA